MSRSPFGSRTTQQAAKICRTERCEPRVGRGNRLIAVIKAKEFQATRTGVGNIQQRIGGHLILHPKVPLLVIRSPQIGLDGIKFRRVGVRERGRWETIRQGIRAFQVEGSTKAIERTAGSEGRIGSQVPAWRGK